MEEIYILSDGSKVDLSGKSQFEITSFLIKNPGAKKTKGVAKSAIVTPKKNQAQTNVTGSKSTTGSSASVTKYRLSNDNDFEAMQKQGLVPPPSATKSTTMNLDDMYGSPIDAQQKNYKDYYTLKKSLTSDFDKNWRFRLENKKPIKTPKKTENIYDEVYSIKNNSVTRVNAKRDIDIVNEKIQQTDSELLHPYLFYSSKNQQQQDTFLQDNYNTKELEALGINIDDFDGYINKKGYKTDFLDKQAKGLYEGQGRSAWGGYDIGLAKELAKKKLLNMYMEDMQRRDFTRQDLNQEIEVISGMRDKKEIKRNELFNTNGIANYVEKYFPLITQKLKDKDKENAKIYEESKKGGTDFWTWDTASKMGSAGWNAIVDRTKQFSSTVYDFVGMDATAEEIRMLDEENKLIRPDDRGIGYVSGKTVKYNNTNYIVDSKGEIYDADAKIRVTDLFNEDAYKKLVEESKYGPEDWTFSTQGAAVQTSGVMADMLLQAALTRGVGSIGAIASETRIALNATRQTSKFTSLVNDTSQLLRKVPLDRSTGYSMIAQGAMGYSQGYEDTLKAARDNGINDKDAFKLATSAAQRMAVLYSTTGVINPQTKLVENIFGSKNIIKKAIEQYTKTGEKGFIKYIDDMIKNTPRNLVEFAEEGGKEVVQENIQQVGEISVNKMTNAAAGQKIMNDVMSGDDFMNTSILSFISSGLMSKAKLPSFHAGDQSIDDLTSLSTLAKNRKEFDKIADGLLDKKVFTPDQIEKLKADVGVYANNINKLPKTITPDAAMPIMRELDKITKLTDEKQTVDKAFHPQIDEKIESIRQTIVGIQYESDVKVKNKAIANAIKKGIVKNSSMKTFSTTAELETYLTTEFDIDKAEAKKMAKRGGFMLDESNLKNYSKNPENVKPGEKLFIVNEEVGKALDAPEVIQHEFGHGLIYETIKNDPEAQTLLGVALSKEIMKLQDASNLKGDGQTPVPEAFIKRFGKYVDLYKGLIAEQDAKLELGTITKQERDAAVNKYLGNQWEEILTLYSDAISNGSVQYNEGTFSKLKDVIRQVLQYLGLKNIKFESGRDVYNFIRDYNKSVETGSWGVAMKRLGTKGAEINKEALRKEVGMKVPVSRSTDTSSDIKYSLDERKSSENIKKDVNKNYDKEKWSAGTNSRGENPAIDRVLFDILGEYDYIIKGKARALRYDKLPGYTQDDSDMIAETKIALIPHIRNFNKEFLEKREEYKKELEDQGLDPKSQEFKDKVEAQDEKGYKGKKGIVKENNDLNAWINSQLINKMGNALRSGNVTTKVFTEDIEGEGFKETRVLSDFAGDVGEESTFLDESDNIFDAQQEFEDEQNKLAVLLTDPVFRFTDEKGKPLNIETVPFGGFFVTEANDPSVSANRKLRTETDPAKIADLNRQIKELARGLELQNKPDLTYEEKEELKGLKSFKSYDLSTGMMVNTFEALSVEDTPAKIISDEVGREILRSPNIETLEYRNFKEKLSTLSKTMARRMTFKNGPEIESLMYHKWKLLYGVINHPVDPITGESSYASKKLPPRLKEFDEKGNLKKIGSITRAKFLQSYYGNDEAARIMRTYGDVKTKEELKELEEPEINDKTGKGLVPTAYFDRRTALMELFGDVLVLQEARRLIRQPEFLEKIAERNVNLYNALKDDVIRASVLNNMAKGKSDMVKFSIPADKKVKPKPDFITTNPYNMVGDNPMYSLKYDELFSSPSDFVKFSIDEIEEPSQPILPKYKDALVKATGIADDSEGWILKAIQLSDIQDDDINVKKLHTFKTGAEIVNEINNRYRELTDSMYAFNDNPWIIKEYKEGYIDTMLERSLNNPEEEFHIPYWTQMKNDEDFRRSELKNIQAEQYFALRQLVDNLNGSEFLDGADLTFFRYLFIKDVLSNRYYSQNEDNIIKKSIKKSEYKTTIQPIQEFNDIKLISEVYRYYSNKKSTSLAGIYLLKKLNEKPIDFNDNFINGIDDKNNLYKFNKGDDSKEIKSLSTLASYSSKAGYRGCTWCTGNASMAQSQLSNGDFYIIANKDTKIPVLAIRYVGDDIAEMAGTRDNQDLWNQDFDKVEFAINNLPSKNKELALNQLTIARKLSNFTIEELNNMNSIEDLNKLVFSKNINIHFESELYKKSKAASTRAKRIVVEERFKSGIPASEMYKEGFNINDDGKSIVTSEFDLEVLNKLTEFTESVDIIIQTGPEVASDLEFFENVWIPYEDIEFAELKKAERLEISGLSTFSAPKLTDAERLSIEFVKSFEEPHLYLPPKINYDIDLTFFDGDPEDIHEVNVFKNQIDMSNNNLSLYFNDQEHDAVNLGNVQNANILSVTSVVTDSVILPDKIRILQTENIYSQGGDIVEMAGIKELEKLEMEWDGFDTLHFSRLKKLGELHITLRDEYDADYEEIIRDTDIFKLAGLVTFTFEDHDSGEFKTKTLKKPKLSDDVKFSLAEENNGNLSPFLQGLPFTEQWVVARDIDNAFEKAKMSTNTEIDFKVPDLIGLDDKAIAYFIISKAAEGYNNFEFFNEDNSKGPLTKQVLNTIDIKSEEYKKNRDRINNIEKTINDFIETNKGVASEETFSPETAKNLGKNIGKHDIYLPPEDEDFEGLLYTLATARGKEGEMQLDFLRDTLLKPYSDAMLNLMKARQTMYKDWRELINKKYKGISKELKQDSGYGGYLIDQAVRVYLWNSAPYPIPGLDKKDLFNLNEIVRTNPRLRAFAADVSLLSKQANGYVEPDSNWGFGSVVGDINNVISKSNRKKYLEPWVKNIDKAFSKDNLSKIEAIYGRKYVIALKNTLDRMKTGSNRSEGANDKFLNWLNGSTAVTMFANIRSAVLQLLGAVNYINTTDNNILKAGAALINVPQYMQDVKTIWNSDYLKDRRSGLMNDVAEAELAQVMNDPRNKSVLDKFKAANYWILKMGYAPTRFADSLAIAFGGAAFYRNRLNTYLKQGNTQEEAERLTQRDFYQVSEQSQQSADVSKISMNQASVKGRLILAFQNTPLQYSRLIKRSVIDLAKGRGSVPNNVAKIVYYGAIQNMMFNFLQNGLFSLLWDDDEEQQAGKFDSAKIRAVSGTMDTLLRGSGLNGALIATVKNAFIKWYEKSGDPKGYGDVGLELANVAPSIGIKLRAGTKAYKAIEYNMDEIKYKGFSLDNQYAIEAATSLTSATTNFPADRLMTKINNVSNALNEENEPWQRIFSLLGYTKYNLGIEDGSGGVDTRSKLKVPELKAPELKIPVLK
jgi:hypothetical protein